MVHQIVNSTTDGRHDVYWAGDGHPERQRLTSKPMMSDRYALDCRSSLAVAWTAQSRCGWCILRLLPVAANTLCSHDLLNIEVKHGQIAALLQSDGWRSICCAHPQYCSKRCDWHPEQGSADNLSMSLLCGLAVSYGCRRSSVRVCSMKCRSAACLG
jgi:hypothetical protein